MSSDPAALSSLRAAIPAGRPIRIATRRSRLAMVQAEHLQAAVQRLLPGHPVELLPMESRGDQDLHASLANLGGTGVFVRELESALLEERADLAVHSMKDLPTQQPPGLVVEPMAGRADPRECVVTTVPGTQLGALPDGALIGTSSPRRVSQLLRARPSWRTEPIRGNVETRIRKVREGQAAATLLARAGLDRLGLTGEASQTLELDELLPAPAQGVLGLECRDSDDAMRALILALSDPDLQAVVAAERTLLRTLEGGCHAPIAAYADWSAPTDPAEPRSLRLRAYLGRPDGSQCIRRDDQIPVDPAATDRAAIGRTLGATLARQILAAGGDTIMADLRAADE